MAFLISNPDQWALRWHLGVAAIQVWHLSKERLVLFNMGPGTVEYLIFLQSSASSCI